jgi:hypothetical protein
MIPEEHQFMPRFTHLVFALACAITCTSYAQQPAAQPSGEKAATPAAATTTKPAPEAANVPLTEPVITLKGACQSKAGSTPSGCVSSLTREQFEQLTNALQPADRGPVPPAIKRRFATQYAKLLTFADAARELGLENDPKVKEVYSFAMNQILAESLNQHYMQAFAHPSEQQIQDYYNQHLKDYREATLQRIIIPVNQGNADKSKPTEAEQKAYAQQLRDRWATGEDPVKLEKEAMQHSGMTSVSPDVELGKRRPGSLPETHESVFDMKANDVSQPFSDAAAIYIYRLVSVQQLPLSEVQASISQILQRQMFADKIKQVEAAVTPELNDAYFGPEEPPSVQHGVILPGGPAPSSQGSAPPAKPEGAAGAPSAANSGASPK